MLLRRVYPVAVGDTILVHGASGAVGSTVLVNGLNLIGADGVQSQVFFGTALASMIGFILSS